MRSRIEIEADIASLRTRIENAKQRGVSPFKVKQLESQLMSLKGQLEGGQPVKVNVQVSVNTEKELDETASVFNAKRMTATEAEMAEAKEKGTPFVAVDPATKEGDMAAEVTGFRHEGKTYITDVKVEKPKKVKESDKNPEPKSKKSGRSKKRK